MDLFEEKVVRFIKPVVVSIEERIEAAVNTLYDLFMQDVPQAIAFSAGKDSTAVLILSIWAGKKAVANGKTPVMWIVNADTGVENPIVSAHARTELQKAKAYAVQSGINAEIGVATPVISSGWLLRIVGGRAMPSFPENNADCSVSWKQEPMQKLRSNLLSRLFLETNMEPVTLTGTRFDESISRGAKMKKRGESATAPVRNKAGELVLSPIALWSEDDVWELLGLVRAGVYQSYTDTEDLFRIYTDAGPTSCAVVNDAIIEGGASSRGGCGARTGCWTCVKVKTDASMDNLLEKEEYAFMRGLNDLREFIAATQYDLSRRQWFGRSIKKGYIAIRPDAYHPKMQHELLRYVLTLQAQENQEAMLRGIRPRFQIISPAGLIGVDAMWSLNGYHQAFTAIEDYYEIFHLGKRYAIPKLETFPKVEMPEPRFLYVGDWDEDATELESVWSGLRDPVGESLWEWSKCMETKQLTNGRTVLDVNTDESFSVDEESASLMLELEVERILSLRKSFMRVGGYTQAYKWYLARGTISLAKGQVGIHDRFCRRTAFKERYGLCGPDYDLQDLIDASVPWHEAPVDVQEAFLKEGKLDKLNEALEMRKIAERQHSLFA